MSYAFRVFYSLVFSFSFINPVLAQSQSSSSALNSVQSPAETAVRGVAEKYFALHARKDLDGLMSLWSSKSPELQSRKKSAEELFASSKEIALKSFAVRQVRVVGDRARVRVEADIQVIEAKTGKEKDEYGKLFQTLECVKEADGWKVVKELATYDELANALLAAKGDEDRAVLLKNEPELVTTELSRALGRSSDQLRSEKKYPAALAAAELALKLSEQLNDRAGQGLAWEQIGRAYRAQLDFRRALENYQKALAVFEGLGDKREISSILGRIATSYYFMENYQAAVDTNLRRLKLKEELNDREWMASTLDDLTSNYQHLGNYPAALETARRAIAVYEELNDDGGVARVLILLGNIQLEQSNYEQAIANFQRAGAIFAKNGDIVGPALATLNTGEAYASMGDYSRALEAYQQALAVFTKRKSLLNSALALSNIGGVYSELNDHDQAREYFRRSLSLYEQNNRPFGRAEVFNAIGNSYRRQGNYALALEHLRQGLKLLEESGRKYGLAGALTEMGDLYMQQGDEKLALEFYQRSQTIFEELGSKDKLAALVSRRGTLEQRRGNYEQALAAYEQSLTLYKAIGHKLGMAEAYATIGESYLLLNQPERALENYRDSLKVFEEIGNKNGVGSVMTGIARVEQTRNDHTKALSFAKEAAALAEKTGNLELSWEISSLIGKSQMALKQPNQARQSFEEAVATIEKLRGQAAGGELAQRYFLEHRLEPYHALISLLVGQGKASEALAWAERSKARVLLDVIQSGRADVSRAITAAEQKQERALRAEIISLNTQVTRISQQDKPDQVRLEELKSLREKARVNYEAFRTSLYAAHSELKVHRGEAPLITSEEIATLLPDAGSALLEYVVTDNTTYLFAVTKQAGNTSPTVRVFTLPIKRAELASQTESFRQRLASRDLAFRDAAQKLSDLLLRPAQAQLSGKTNLVLVPDDVLLGLPFQALLTRGNRFLLEESALSYAPSLTVLRQMTKRRIEEQPDGGNSELLALGNPLLGKETIERANSVRRDEKFDPLPEAEEEVKALGRLYGASRSKVFVGAEAREDRAKAEAGQVRVLHFATHGTLNNSAPMYSNVVLAQGDKNDDGLLEAWELMEMDLKADLVVLSACETARGRYGAGEGMIGLSWAMFVAGVPSTVVSQWKVESASTRDLMVSFHRGLSSSRAGKTKATKTEALRQASLKLLKNSETSHPFYWAGFVLVGDGR